MTTGAGRDLTAATLVLPALPGPPLIARPDSRQL
jgi:hypothetical protein